MGTLQAANLMPLRYSGEKLNEELKVCSAGPHDGPVGGPQRHMG